MNETVPTPVQIQPPQPVKAHKTKCQTCGQMVHSQCLYNHDRGGERVRSCAPCILKWKYNC